MSKTRGLLCVCESVFVMKMFLYRLKSASKERMFMALTLDVRLIQELIPYENTHVRTKEFAEDKLT